MVWVGELGRNTYVHTYVLFVFEDSFSATCV